MTELERCALEALNTLTVWGRPWVSVRRVEKRALTKGVSLFEPLRSLERQGFALARSSVLPETPVPQREGWVVTVTGREALAAEEAQGSDD